MAGTRTASAERSKELVRIVVYMLSKASLRRGFFISAMKTPFASFRLARGGIKASGVLIVENAEADRQCMDCRMYRTPSRGGLCGLD